VLIVLADAVPATRRRCTAGRITATLIPVAVRAAGITPLEQRNNAGARWRSAGRRRGNALAWSTLATTCGGLRDVTSDPR
jgi:hypothetical protein